MIEEDFYDQKSIIFAKAKSYQELSIDRVVNECNRWKLSFLISLIVSLLFAFGLIVVALKKEIKPVLVKYNEITGDVTVTEVENQSITDEDAITALHKHWVKQFIVCAETYHYTDQERLWECVNRFSSDDVFTEIYYRYDPQNLDNWFERYGVDTIFKPQIISINDLPYSKSDIKENKTLLDRKRWLVKFYRVDNKNSRGDKPVSFSAVIETEFQQIAKNTRDIYDNPLSFNVITYRLDYISSIDEL